MEKMNVLIGEGLPYKLLTMKIEEIVPTFMGYGERIWWEKHASNNARKFHGKRLRRGSVNRKYKREKKGFFLIDEFHNLPPMLPREIMDNLVSFQGKRNKNHFVTVTQNFDRTISLYDK